MTTRRPKYTPQEALPLANAVYERLRAEVEPGNIGKAIALDVDGGDYEIDQDFREASTRLRQRKPEAHIICLKIGGGAIWRLGHVGRTSET